MKQLNTQPIIESKLTKKFINLLRETISMEYEIVKFDSFEEDSKKYDSWKDKAEFSLKTLDKLQYEMPAVCH